MGERRLARLSEEFDVRVERRFLEIHPETPAEGRPVSELGYPPDIVDGRWILEGAVPVEMLREVAQKVAAGKS